MKKIQILLIIVLFTISLFCVRLLIVSLSTISIPSDSMWFQSFVQDPYFYNQVTTVVTNQLLAAPELTVISTDTFDNIYRWFFQKDSIRVQVRVLPTVHSDEIQITINKINDEFASLECLEQEREMYLNGITGSNNGQFNNGFGIEFKTLQDLSENLERITAEVRNWETKKTSDGYENAVVVLYNCQEKILRLH